VVKHVDAVELRVVVAEILAVAADAVHVHSLAKETAWRRGARGRERAGRSGAT
jgi:hypothetical protein